MNSADNLSLTLQEVSIPLVIESQDGLVANTEPLKTLLLEVKKESKIAFDEVGVKKIDELSSGINSFVSKFSRYRIDRLRSITDIPKSFIEIENELKGLAKELKTESSERTHAQREELYALADENMNSVLLDLVSNSEYGKKVDLRLFDGALQKMRDKAYAQPTKSGKPTPKIKSAIRVLWDIEYASVEKRERVAELKKVEAFQFEQNMKPTNGSYEELLEVQRHYNDVLASIHILYPNSIDEFTLIVKTKLEVIDSSLESKKAQAIAEEKAKSEAILDEGVRLRLMELMKQTLLSKSDHDKALAKCRVLYAKANSKETMSQIHSYANKIKQGLVDIESKEREERQRREQEDAIAKERARAEQGFNPSNNEQREYLLKALLTDAEKIMLGEFLSGNGIQYSIGASR